ncbi:hypothetical protein DE146DRAFT_674789 [Phaeosphaeria sp. MPI-PUGE-AT-0046c]|nr:hypothetical protein DE146DRAFT_674789 [Phaeosphaeria sp. MPI-PUGE-AT-0046c]
MAAQNPISTNPRSSFRVLPTELWLQILEDTSINEAEHLWISVRHTCRQFRDYVERLFVTTYLPRFAISLTLPRRDAESGALLWPGTIPKAELIMALDRAKSDNKLAAFVSPTELKYEDRVKSVEELKDSDTLPKARMVEAKAWVFVDKSYISGRSLQLSRYIEWDEQSKRWVWQLEWRDLISRFYKSKIEARESKLRKLQAMAIRRR